MSKDEGNKTNGTPAPAEHLNLKVKSQVKHIINNRMVNKYSLK